MTQHCSTGSGACPQPWPCPPCRGPGCPVPATPAGTGITGPAEPAHRARRTRARRRAGTRSRCPGAGSGRASLRAPAPAGGSSRKNAGGFVPNRTGRDLFVSRCRFRPPLLYFRFLPAAAEPNEPAAAVRGQQLEPPVLARPGSGSALPVPGWAVPRGAVPQHLTGAGQDFALQLGFPGPRSPRRSPARWSCLSLPGGTPKPALAGERVQAQQEPRIGVSPEGSPSPPGSRPEPPGSREGAASQRLSHSSPRGSAPHCAGGDRAEQSPPNLGVGRGENRVPPDGRVGPRVTHRGSRKASAPASRLGSSAPTGRSQPRPPSGAPCRAAAGGGCRCR